MGLVRVELTRLLARRAVLWLVFATFAIPAFIGAMLAWQHRPLSDSDIAEAQREVEISRSQPWVQEQVDHCMAGGDEWLPPNERDGDIEAACRRHTEPQLDWYLWRTELDLEAELDGAMGSSMAMIVVALLMMAGTTFIGHDWATGSVTNQLLFEPRRDRVWAAKAVAVGVVAAVMSAVVHASFWIGLWTAARAYDHAQPDGILGDALQQSGRAVLLTVAAAVGAYAVTMFFRHTVATVGIMAVAAIAGTIILAIAGIDPPWMPHVNFDAVLRNGTTYSAEVACSTLPDYAPQPEFGFREACFVERNHPLWHGAAYLGTLLLAVGVLSLASFRRRDV